MKSGGSYTLPAKRRWRWLVIGVLGLVLLSMLVPLVFLLGLHNGFHSAGYLSEQKSSSSNGGRDIDTAKASNTWNPRVDKQSSHVNNSSGRLGSTVLKNIVKESPIENENKSLGEGKEKHSQPTKLDQDIVKESPIENENQSLGEGKEKYSQPTKPVGVLATQAVPRSPSPVNTTDFLEVANDGSEKLCELKYGSYCLWRQEHKEEMNDLTIKKVKDLLFVARAYYPSIAKLPNRDKLSNELRQNIQEFERILSETTVDTDLPPQIEKKLQKMQSAIARAKSFGVDCNNVDKKFRQLVDLTEDEANFHMKQSAFLYQITVQTMQKSHHCLAMRLTVEYFKSATNMELPGTDKYMNPELHHYVIFSKNVLASSVVVNSTVMYAKDSGRQIFHLLTDQQNYFAMKLWFSTNVYKEASVQVLNIEDLKLQSSIKSNLRLSLSEEFRVALPSALDPPTSPARTEYISVFSHSHFLLPEIFYYLKKVVVLDDDVVVRKDLSALWSLNMEGKINGAVQCCKVRLGHLEKYLAGSSFNPTSCAWMSGLNVIDLVSWRKHDLSLTYKNLLQEQQKVRPEMYETFALRASFLSFQNHIYPLDGTWALSGLGHDYAINTGAIRGAAVLHYNGYMKPWLDLGIPKYRGYWKKFLSRDSLFLSECNLNS